MQINSLINISHEDFLVINSYVKCNQQVILKDLIEQKKHTLQLNDKKIKLFKFNNNLAIFNEIFTQGGFKQVSLGITTNKNIPYIIKATMTMDNKIAKDMAQREVKILSLFSAEKGVVKPFLTFQHFSKSATYNLQDEMDMDSQDSCEIIVESVLKHTFFFPYYRDGNLEEFISKQGLSIDKAISLFQDIIEGLTVIHEKNIVHSDLKPQNILIDPSKGAAISDFGTSFIEGAEVYMGSDQEYRAPEVWRAHFLNAPKEAIGKPSDICSLGYILYFMLFLKKHPHQRTEESFKDKSSQEITEMLNQPALVPTGSFGKLIATMTHPDPTARPTIQQVKVIFEELVEETSIKNKKRPSQEFSEDIETEVSATKRTKLSD